MHRVLQYNINVHLKWIFCQTEKPVQPNFGSFKKIENCILKVNILIVSDQFSLS